MSFVFKRLLLAVQRGRESRARLWLSLFVRCLRWPFGEGRVTQRSSKREPHMDKSHFILLHSALKLKKLFSVERTIFSKHFLLCCISFSLLGKILLVACIQMAFTRCKRSGYMRLGKMDFQRPVCAAKKSFRLVPCLENIIVHVEVVFNAVRFCITPVLSKEKSIHWYP